MNINQRAEKAVELKRSGCNCCQAVCAACADLGAADVQELLKLSSGFGVGMGCMEATCGALVGAVMIAGEMKQGRGTIAAARQILSEFRDSCGATLCKELKGRDTGKVLCECDNCVRYAIVALGKVMGVE